MSNFVTEIFTAHCILQTVLLNSCPEKYKKQLQKIVDDLDQIVEGEVNLDDIRKFLDVNPPSVCSFDDPPSVEDMNRELKEMSLRLASFPSSTGSSNLSQIPSPVLNGKL